MLKKIINFIGQEVTIDTKCKGCGYDDPIENREHIDEFGKHTYSCDHCKKSSIFYKDYTEKAIKENMTPGKSRELAIENHRKQKAEGLRKYPNIIKKNYSG